MIVLEVNKFFQYLESFIGSRYQRFFSIIAPILIFVSMLLITFWIFLNFIFNFNDNIGIALSSLPTAFGFFMMTVLYGHFLINRDRFHSLFEDMQGIVNDSTYESCVI